MIIIIERCGSKGPLIIFIHHNKKLNLSFALKCMSVYATFHSNNTIYFKEKQLIYFNYLNRDFKHLNFELLKLKHFMKYVLYSNGSSLCNSSWCSVGVSLPFLLAFGKLQNFCTEQKHLIKFINKFSLELL